MDKFIFDKTDKGREEIVTRKYRLASRLRALLVLIDGKKSTPELLRKVSGLGLDEQSIVELIDGDFIGAINGALNGTLDGAIVEPSAETETLADHVATLPEAASAVDQSEPAAENIVLEGHQLILVQSFFNETIKSAIGLRGFGLQLKVERASTLEEFRGLRQQYFNSVSKSRGHDVATSLTERLDALLADAERYGH